MLSSTDADVTQLGQEAPAAVAKDEKDANGASPTPSTTTEAAFIPHRKRRQSILQAQPLLLPLLLSLLLLLPPLMMIIIMTISDIFRAFSFSVSVYV